jgi:glycopeptide antibiotics resistance protein
LLCALCTALGLHRAVGLPLTTAFGALLSLSIELSQAYIYHRFSQMSDLLLNSVGTLLGAVGILVGSVWWRRHFPAR